MKNWFCYGLTINPRANLDNILFFIQLQVCWSVMCVLKKKTPDINLKALLCCQHESGTSFGVIALSVI